MKKCSKCGVKVDIRDEDKDSYEQWSQRHRAASGCTGEAA